MSNSFYKRTADNWAMDEDVLVQQLVNRLTFEVEPLGADDVLISPNRNGTPLNVKVRVRNKDEPKLIQRGVVPLPRGKPATIPERIQLIGSDQTIISFNVLMEATSSKESSPGSRKRGFHFFKLGGCLGTSYDEDDGPYLPGTSNKDALRTNRSSKSASLIMDEVEESSEKNKFNTVPRNQKGLFGQCKPGGCLDPPFGEDKYPYSLPNVQPGTNLKQPLNKIEDKKEKINAKSLESVKTPKDLNEASKAVAKSEGESNPVLSLYPRSDEEHPITSQYSNSIITYPPVLTSSQTQSNEQSMEKKSKNRSFDCGSTRSSYEYPETFFIPPKDVIRQKEEERRYSKELSNDTIKFDDDERNKDKVGLVTFRSSIDKNSTAVDRFRNKERTEQELIKQTDIKIPDFTYLTNKKDGEKGNTGEGLESSKVDSNDGKSNRQIEKHDTYPESGRRFTGNEDDLDELETMSYDTDTKKDTPRFGGNEDAIEKLKMIPHDTDTIKGTGRFGGIEDDIDKQEAMPHDTDTIKGTRRFGGNEDDIVEQEPTTHDTDTIKGTRRFGENEDNIDKLEPKPRDADIMKGTRRFGENEDDIDQLEPMPHDADIMKAIRWFGGNEGDPNEQEAIPYDTDTMKGTRRFGGNEDDTDKLEPKPRDADIMKGTRRFGEHEDDIDQLEPMPHDADIMKAIRGFGGNEGDPNEQEAIPYDTDTMKGTRRFGGNEDDTDKLEPKPRDADIMKGTRRFGENEDDIDQLEPMPHDADIMKAIRGFGGNEGDPNEQEAIPYDTDTMKGTRRFGGNEDDTDKLEPKPRDADIMKGTRRFGENEDDIDQLEPMPHDADIMKAIRGFGGNEGDPNEQEAIPYDTDTMKGTPKFGGNEDDIDKQETSKSVNAETTPTTAGQNSKGHEDSKGEQKSFIENKAVRKDGITNDDQVLLTSFENLDTTNATKDDLSSAGILSENKEFATSSIESMNSGENLTNDKLKENILNNENKELYSEKVSPPWENIHNEMLPQRRSSAIFQKTPFVEVTHDEISKSNPLRRNTFTIIDSSTSLQKRIEDISTQRYVTENSQIDNGNVSVIVETKTYFEPSLRIMSSDTEANVTESTRSSDTLPSIHDLSTNKNVEDANSSRNNPSAEVIESHKPKNGLDIQKHANPITEKSLLDNSTNIANITSDTQLSTARDHTDDKKDVNGYVDIGDIPPDSALKDELIDKTIKEKTNNSSKTGSSIQDATLHGNLETNCLSPDKTILKPKVLDESKTILVNLSFQSYVDANEKRVIQTLNPLIKPHPRYKDDTITVFQSYINYGNEIRIPVNPQNDLILNLFDKNQKLGDIKKDHAEEKRTGTTNPENILKKNLSVIYETGLIPLYSVIKDLIEEINTLSAQQELLRAKVGRAERSKSLRLIPVNNRCGCRRN